MSSRILQGDLSVNAATLSWRAVGSPIPAGHEPSTSPSSPSHNYGSSSGPTWDQYHSLETRLRELEQQIPLREQQARQAAIRQADDAAAARWQAALEKLAHSITDIASHRTRLRRDAEQDVVKLSLAIARRILRRELTMDHDALLGLIKTAFEKLDIREVHRVRLRSDDVDLVKAYLERLGCPVRVEVQPDPSLERGGVVIETQRGNLDISLDTQLEEIERGFTDMLQRKSQS